MSQAKFDVFLSHHGPDKPAVEKLAAILEKHGFRTWLDKWNLVAGNAWQPDLEQALLESKACAVIIGPSGLGPWQNQEMRLAIQRQVESRQTDQPFRVIPVLLPGATRGDRAKLPPFLTANTWVEFSRPVDDDPAALEKLIAGLEGLPVRPCLAAEPDLRDGPYRGLEYFDVHHAGLFFGRDDLVDWLLSCLRGTQSKDGPTRFLAILGASGSGKSSLARAGLLHALKQGGWRGSAAWPQAICRPGSRPLESLIESLAKAEGFSLGRGTHAELFHKTIADLRRSPDSLHLSALGGLPASPFARRLVLLVDQFEELFTLAAEPDRPQQEADRQAFIDNLLYAATVEDGPVVVILTLRADFCGKCARYPKLADAVAAHQSLVGPMTESQLRDAILRPAELVHCRFDPGLADLLVREVCDEPGALPLLQFALRELWKRQDVDRFTVDAYREIGGLRGALERHANGVLQSLDGDAEQDLCRRILLRLVQPGEGTEDTKRRVLWCEILPDAADQAPVAAIVKRLADERLIVTDGEHIEIAHEALIRDWAAFANWIDADRAGLRTHRRLTEAANEWRAKQRDPGLLYKDTRLAVANDWAEKHPQELNQFEGEFLQASLRSREEERQRELKSARRLRRLAQIAVAVAVVAIISLALAAWQSSRLSAQATQLKESYEKQAVVLFKAAVTANDDDLPAAVENLREYQDAAIEMLRQILRNEETPTSQQGRAALALVAFGDDVGLIGPALRLAEDATVRTKFIHGYRHFRGDLRKAAAALDAVKTDSAAADFRSALGAALGLIPWEEIETDNQSVVLKTMLELYRDAPDGATHSAAYFALKHWGQEKALPELPRSPFRPTNGCSWFVNSQGLTMIRIHQGAFQMGDDDYNGTGNLDEKPRHRVTLTQDFYLGDREVTVRQFREFVHKAADHPKCTKAEKQIAENCSKSYPTITPVDDCPVTHVTWFEAVAFCNWLSHAEGLTPCYRLNTSGPDIDSDWKCALVRATGGYRLPSEAQWEYACRAVSQAQYAFGDDDRLLAKYTWYGPNATGRTWPAGNKLPNGWGLFDMHGNVWEWCEDWYEAGYYRESPRDNPLGPGMGSERVVRGGCWYDSRPNCRATRRDHFPPGKRLSSLGFRVAAVGVEPSAGQANSARP